MATIEDVKGWNPFMLAGVAGCASPDEIAENGEDSPGAAFLRSVLTDTVERVEIARGEGVAWSEMVEHLQDQVAEIADAAPDVYTYPRWREFVDLAAWEEDPTEVDADLGDLTACAGVCLYLIAERLAAGIVEMLAEEGEEGEAEE